MAIKKIEDLKKYFETGDKPTQNEFADLIDSFLHRGEEALYLVSITLNDEGNAVLKFSNEETIIVKNSEIQQLWVDHQNGNISTDKNVGIGEHNPDAKLDIVNTDPNLDYLRISNGEDVFKIDNDGVLVNKKNVIIKEGRIEISDKGLDVYIGTGTGENDDLSDNQNVGIGFRALRANTSGARNTAVGTYSQNVNTIGQNNTTVGYATLIVHNSGNENTVSGSHTGMKIEKGSRNTIYGSYAGFWYGDHFGTGSTEYVTEINNSVLIGYATRPQSDNSVNENVIGYAAIGNGSNTVTLGNDYITKTYLKGSTSIDNPNPEAKLDIVNKNANLDHLRISSSSSEENSGDILTVNKDGDVRIGADNNPPENSAKLQLDSSSKGFLPPRMTNDQRIAINNPAIGLVVYCTDEVNGEEGLYVNKSKGWKLLG